jgi:hypothetical protein
MPPIDLGRLRIAPRSARVAKERLPRPQGGQHFLKGPIPLEWLELAARLPGRSLHVGVSLWFLGGVHRSRVIPLSNHTSRRFGLDRNSKYRGLDWLEQAGLISVERKLGRAPLVTILEPEGTHDRKP